MYRRERGEAVHRLAMTLFKHEQHNHPRIGRIPDSASARETKHLRRYIRSGSY